MSTHHLIAEIPVNGGNHFCAHCRRWAIECVPDKVVAFVHGNDSGPILIPPGDGTMIGHLSTTTGEKDGGIKSYLITFDSDDFGTTFVGKAIFMVEQFCFQH